MEKKELFNNWLIMNGAKLNNIYIKEYSTTERGVHASDDIASNDRVVSIPLKLLIHDGMSIDTIYHHEIQLSQNKGYFKDMRIINVLFYMLQEYLKGDSSFFKPYLNILPENISHFPLFWDKTYMSYLENTDIPVLVGERLERFSHDFELAKSKSATFSRDCSKEIFLWLRCIIGSRNFGLNINGTNRSVMAPLGDMLNHSSNCDVGWGFDNTDKVYYMNSNRSISKNSEIFDSYGSKDNSQYFLYYGFTLPYKDIAPYSRNDSYNLEINYNINEELSQKKLKSIEPKTVVKITNNNVNKILKEVMFPYIRTCVSDESELYDAKNPINNINELKTLLTSRYLIGLNIDNLDNNVSKLVNKNILFNKDNFINNILQYNKQSLQKCLKKINELLIHVDDNYDIRSNHSYNSHINRL